MNKPQFLSFWLSSNRRNFDKSWFIHVGLISFDKSDDCTTIINQFDPITVSAKFNLYYSWFEHPNVIFSLPLECSQLLQLGKRTDTILIRFWYDSNTIISLFLSSTLSIFSYLRELGDSLFSGRRSGSNEGCWIQNMADSRTIGAFK